MDSKTQQLLSEKNRRDYNDLATQFDLTRQRIWSELKGQLPRFEPNDRVLDLGCGNGRLIDAHGSNHVKEYVGVDVSEESIKNARAAFKTSHPEARFEVGDATRLEFAGGYFDKLLMVAVLHQIPGVEAREQVLREIHRVLKPGGLALLSVWDLSRLKFWPELLKFTLKKLFGQHSMDWGDILVPRRGTQIQRYYHVFTRWGLQKLLLEMDFEIVSAYQGKNFVYLLRKKG
ncbi:MAG: class I SAM-dependent methyltransferase [bacterium]